MSNFRPAVRKSRKLKIGLLGPSGYGKTYTALSIATRLALSEKTKVAFVDSEDKSASVYAGEVDRFGQRFRFDVAELSDDTRPEVFVERLREAERAGYGVVVIDSASHAWHSILDFVDSKASDRGGKFGAGWREATPRWRWFLRELNRSDVHLIVCMRAKMQYAIGDDNKPRKVGVGAEMRQGAEYEFDVIGEFVQPARMEITKTRARALFGRIFPQPGADVADLLLDWHREGSDPVAALRLLLGETFEHLDEYLVASGRPAVDALDYDQSWKLADWLGQEPRPSRWLEFLASRKTPAEVPTEPKTAPVATAAPENDANADRRGERAENAAEDADRRSRAVAGGGFVRVGVVLDDQTNAVRRFSAVHAATSLDHLGVDDDDGMTIEERDELNDEAGLDSAGREV